MRDGKIRPIFVSNCWPAYTSIESLQPPVDSPEHNQELGPRHGPEYWQARRAFLSSYRFSEADPMDRFRERLKRSVKEVNEAAMGTVGEVRQELSKRRFGIRVFRFKITLPSSLVLVSVRCFIPWYRKVERY